MRELKGDQPSGYETVSKFIDAPGGGMMLLQGYAGTGKTFLTGEIVDYARYQDIPTAVTAPTHKAVKVLKRNIDPNVECSTIYANLGCKEFIDDHGNLSFRSDPFSKHDPYKDKLKIIDESSMIDDYIFEQELLPLTSNGVKILFVGDPYQIPPVNHMYAIPFSAKMRAKYNIESVSLKEIIRQAQGSPIIQNATSIRQQIQETRQILDRQEVHNELGWVKHLKQRESGKFFESDILPLFKSDEYNRDIDYVKVVAWRNKTVNYYNDIIRSYLFGENLPKIIVGDKLVADAPVIVDTKIMIHTNDEMEVLGVSVEEEEIGESYVLKYYKAHVRVYDYITKEYDQFILKIIHEDSEAMYEELLQGQRILAKSYAPGSWQAKSAWIYYYRFIEAWHRVKYSYCITAHKAQASTFHTTYVIERDILVNPDVFERNRILYTACTRSSTNLFVEY